MHSRKKRKRDNDNASESDKERWKGSVHGRRGSKKETETFIAYRIHIDPPRTLPYATGIYSHSKQYYFDGMCLLLPGDPPSALPAYSFFLAQILRYATLVRDHSVTSDLIDIHALHLLEDHLYLNIFHLNDQVRRILNTWRDQSKYVPFPPT